MDAVICEIDISKNQLDNEYTFFEDGRIRHFFDPSAYKLNQESWITAADISDREKDELLKACTEEHRERINGILLG